LKPAYFCAHDEQDDYQLLLEKGFPSVEVVPGQATMFFTSPELRDQFLADMKGVELYSYQYYIEVGKVLGYPPIASEFFAKYIGNLSELEKYGAGFDYCGRHFAGHIKDVEQIAQWLWENVPVPPKPVHYEYQGQTFTLIPDHAIL
jgi:hypothetical protein